MENKVPGLRTCSVCGRDFPLIAEKAYAARDAEQGSLAAIVGDMESWWYDVIDCPHCGCQNVLQERKRPLTPEDDPGSCADCCGGCPACPGSEEVDHGE